MIHYSSTNLAGSSCYARQSDTLLKEFPRVYWRKLARIFPMASWTCSTSADTTVLRDIPSSPWSRYRVTISSHFLRFSRIEMSRDVHRFGVAGIVVVKKKNNKTNSRSFQCAFVSWRCSPHCRVCNALLFAYSASGMRSFKERRERERLLYAANILRF